MSGPFDPKFKRPNQMSRQHYVSQVYLRRFAAEVGKVWVYDKEDDRIFGPTSTANIAHEHDFYNLREGSKSNDPKIVEKQLAKFEGGFVESMNVAIRIADERKQGFSLEEHARLAKTVAFQHFRTRAWRDQMREMYRESFEEMLNAIWEMAHELSGKEPPNGKFEMIDKHEAEENRAWAHQVEAMMTDKINEVAYRIGAAFWVIVKNISGQPFLTSDSPVAVQQVIPQVPVPAKNPRPHERYIVSTLALPGGRGTQTFFPLAPFYALAVLDHEMYSQSAKRDTHVLCVGKEKVDQINAAQVSESKRWVYASTKDFSGVVPPSGASRMTPFTLPPEP